MGSSHPSSLAPWPPELREAPVSVPLAHILKKTMSRSPGDSIDIVLRQLSLMKTDWEVTALTLKCIAWLGKSEKELNSTIITLYWKQWHQADEIMNFHVADTGLRPPLEKACVWTVGEEVD